MLVLALLFGLDFLAGEVFTIGMAVAASLLWIFTEEEKPARRPLLGGSGPRWGSRF